MVKQKAPKRTAKNKVQIKSLTQEYENIDNKFISDEKEKNSIISDDS